MKKIISITMLMLIALGSFSAQAATTEKAVAKPPVVAPVAKDKPAAASASPVKKTTSPEEEKYPLAYAKCTKVAENDETKYDQLFDDCMEKNGFPQEEFSTGGMPIDSGDGQDD